MAIGDKVGVELKLIGYQQFIRELSDVQKRTKDKTFNIKVKLTPDKGALKNLSKQIGTVSVRVKFVVPNDAAKQLRARVSNIRASVRPTISDSEMSKFRQRLSSGTIKPKIAISNDARAKFRASLNEITVTPKVKVNAAQAKQAATAISGAASSGLYKANVGGTKGMGILTTLGSAGQSMFNAFSLATRNPLSQMVTGMLYQVGFGAMTSMFGQLGNAVSRFDTLTTFSPTMVALGESAEDADKAMSELDQSVRGLPTSLNEIVGMAKQFSLSTGSLDRGKNVAIALNNALLASNADAHNRYVATQQIRDVLSGKELNSKEWMSLQAAISPALAAVSDKLGYKKRAKFLEDLYGGDIANDDFIDALIATSTGTGKNVELANISKQTVEGVINNINIAVARLGENVLKRLNTILEKHTGRDLLETLRGVGTAIDDISASITNWIDKNPDVIIEWLDRIRSFDIKSLLTGIGKGLKDVIGIYSWIFSKLGNSKVGFFLAAGSMYTQIGTMLFGVLKGIGRVVEIIPAMSGITKLHRFFDVLLGKGSIAEDVISSANKLEMAKEGLATAKVRFQRFAIDLASIIAIGGTIAVVAAEAWATFKILQSLTKIKIDWGKVASYLSGFFIAMVSVGGLAAGIGVWSEAIIPALTAGMAIIAAIGGFVTFLTGLAWLNSEIVKETAVNFENIIDTLEKISSKLRNSKFDAGDSEQLLDTIRELVKTADEINLFKTVLTKWKSGNLEKSSSNFLGVVDDLVSLSSKLKELKRPSNAQLDMLNDIVNAMGEFFEQLYDNPYIDTGFLNGDTGLVGKKESKNIKKIIENFKTTIGDISTIASLMNQMYGDLEKLGNGSKISLHSASTTKLDFIKNRMGEILTAIGGIFEEFRRENLQWNLDSGFKHQNGTNEVSNIGTIIGGFDTAINNIDSVVQTMLGMYKRLNNINKYMTKEKGVGGMSLGGTKLDSIVENVKNMLGKMGEIFDEFDKFFQNPVEYGGKNGTKRRESYKDTEKMAETIKGIEEAINTINSITETLGTLGKRLGKMQGTGDSSLYLIKVRIEDMINKLNELADYMKENYTNGDLDEIPSQLTQMASSIGNIKLAAESLVKAGKSMDELGIGSEGSFAVADQLSNLIEQLNNALGDINKDGLLGKITAFNKVIEDINKLLTEFIGSDLSGLTGVETELGNIGEALELLGDEFETFFKKQNERFGNAGEEWRNALLIGLDLPSIETSIQSFLESAFASRSYWENGYSTGLSYANGINAALGQIRTPTSLGGILTGLKTQFRASGGSIFRRRGSDVVPAMLTPGEFVIRKRAVNAYGSEFMARLNRLDLPGAIHALSVRAGSKLMPSASVINNKTTNNTNNAKLTQNIYSNNPNYSYRRANRYVRAL